MVERSEVVQAPRPLPQGRPHPDSVAIQIVGHGLRVTVTPPFQAARMPHLDPEGPEEALVISWWDTTAPNAGLNGDAGLFNVRVVPGPSTEDDTIRTVFDSGVTKLRRGETGTEIQLPEDFTSLGGLGQVEPGPTDPDWWVEHDGERVPFPSGQLLHSEDPRAGAPFSFKTVPARPWGAWPEP
ncbi:MAG: hypothetical protein EA397_11160 [Deltaproteobacteria bacterium]|nr:MAG: hypothetical protein EA397_11160 [Deltaproteobacteria bacterium]